MTCKQCKSIGTLTIDNPAIINQPVTMTCDVCSGTGLKGMTKEQVKWYQTMTKMLDVVRKDMFRQKETDEIAFMTLKLTINKACSRLGIALQTPLNLTWKTELDEYRRRLYAIPVAVRQQKRLEIAA
jgi:hypothetical protein